MTGVATEVICTDCQGGPERCAREGHLRTWVIDTSDPNIAVFGCSRCNGRFTLPRCSCCGRVLVDDRKPCDHLPVTASP